MAFDSKGVLIVAADSAFCSRVIGQRTHPLVFMSTPQSVVDHGIDDGLIAKFPTGARANKQMGGQAHILHSASDDCVGIASANSLIGEHDRHQAAAADFVYGDR